MNDHLHRRGFLAATAVSATALGSTFQEKDQGQKRFEICAFAKPLQWFNYRQVAEKTAAMGFDGIEGTVRPGGQVLPERVEEDLPKLIEQLKRRGLEMTIMASDVNRADSKLNQKVLRTAASLGIKRFRMAYYRYDLSKPVIKQLKQLRPVVRDLASFARELNIKPIYQNHAGANFVGAAVWDIYGLINDLDPETIGIAFDIRHATVEGGMAWPIHWNLVQSHLAAVYAKDFRWDGRTPGNVPLDKGQVDPKFYSMLKQSSFAGPVSLHMEYVDHRQRDLIDASLKAIGEDVKTLRRLLDLES